jgi:hypothetical protein
MEIVTSSSTAVTSVMTPTHNNPRLGKADPSQSIAAQNIPSKRFVETFRWNVSKTTRRVVSTKGHRLTSYSPST